LISYDEVVKMIKESNEKVGMIAMIMGFVAAYMVIYFMGT